MKNLFKENKFLIITLIFYMVTQILCLYFRNIIFLFLYPTFYLATIILGVINIIKQKQKITETGLKKILMTFITNLILTAIYLKTLYLNPEINWKLKDENQFEQDPTILFTYIPGVLFIISTIIFLLTIIIKKIGTVK